MNKNTARRKALLLRVVTLVGTLSRPTLYTGTALLYALHHPVWAKPCEELLGPAADLGVVEAEPLGVPTCAALR